jgi:hypothetical protein
MGSFQNSLRLFLVMVVLAAPGAAHALAIDSTFVPFPQNIAPPGFPFLRAAPAPVTQGGGDFADVFRAAADVWEQAILDDVTVRISFGWIDNVAPDVLAQALSGGRNGLVGFSRRISNWFLDPTPSVSEEWTTLIEGFADLGAGPLNMGRELTGSTGIVLDSVDLFSVALHEIGHVLSVTPALFANGQDGDIDVTAPRPFAGSGIPVVRNDPAHLTVPAGYSGPRPSMFPSPELGARHLLSDADILYVAQGGGFVDVALGVSAVPEPSLLTLYGAGAAVAAALVARRRRVTCRASPSCTR